MAVAIAYAWTWRGIREEIVDAINSAESESEKAEIQRKVVKAIYPPRFRQD